MDELCTVVEGKRCCVVMTKNVAKIFKSVDAKPKARCLKWIEYYANDGAENLNDDKFKHEGRFSIGDAAGTKVAIYTFKAWQLRLYGGTVPDGRFIITEIDAAKKQDSADRSKLERSASKLAPYMR